MDGLTNSTANMHRRFRDTNLANEEPQGIDKDSTGSENQLSDDSNCSDDQDYPINLIAERERRKRLNDNLYELRALVPKVSNLDRISILADAIEFVKELQQQVRELRDELMGEISAIDDGPKNLAGFYDSHNKHVKSEILSQNDEMVTLTPKILSMHDKTPIGFHSHMVSNSSFSKQDHEVQVKVVQLDGNEFFVKVFCEHKLGGFARLMEALNSLGLEVTDANVTSFRGLVSNVFKVEKRESEMVQADHVRDLLLELIRNASRGLPENMSQALKDINHRVHRLSLSGSI